MVKHIIFKALLIACFAFKPGLTSENGESFDINTFARMASDNPKKVILWTKKTTESAVLDDADLTKISSLKKENDSKIISAKKLELQETKDKIKRDDKPKNKNQIIKEKNSDIYDEKILNSMDISPIYGGPIYDRYQVAKEDFEDSYLTKDKNNAIKKMNDEKFGKPLKKPKYIKENPKSSSQTMLDTFMDPISLSYYLLKTIPFIPFDQKKESVTFIPHNPDEKKNLKDFEYESEIISEDFPDDTEKKPSGCNCNPCKCKKPCGCNKMKNEENFNNFFSSVMIPSKKDDTNKQLLPSPLSLPSSLSFGLPSPFSFFFPTNGFENKNVMNKKEDSSSTTTSPTEEKVNISYKTDSTPSKDSTFSSDVTETSQKMFIPTRRVMLLVNKSE